MAAAADAPRAFRFSYDAFYSFYADRADDAELFDPDDGAIVAHVYAAKRHRGGRVQAFVTRNVTTVRRVRHDPAKHAHGLYFLCADAKADARRWLWWVFPEPCANRATGAPEPYLVANHLSFAYDRGLAAKQVRMHTTTYYVNENEDPDVVHVHDPFDDGARVSASGPADAFVKKNRARAPLIMDVLRRPFVGAQGQRGGARKPGKKKREARARPQASVEGPAAPAPAPTAPRAVLTARSADRIGLRAFATGAATASRSAPPGASPAPSRAALVAACDRAFGAALEGFAAIGVRQPNGDWMYSVEVRWRDADAPDDAKAPAYLVRARATGRAAFERAFARALDDGPSRADRSRALAHTSR